MKPLRYAHNEGHTDLCFEESGRYMLTCGTDGDVRIWQGIDDDDTISHRVGDKVYSITFKNGRFFTASDSNSIQAHTFPDGLPDGIVTRFTSPVHHMLLNESGTTMVAGSSDFTIKIVDIESSSHKVCRGHEAPVLSLTLDPKEEFLASSSCDGSIRIWKMDDQSCIKVLNFLPKTNDVSLSKSLSRITWTKDGEYLLIPVDKDIQMIKRSTWEKTSTLSFPQITQTIAVMSLSPNHKYLAMGCIDGVMCIIDWQKNRFIESHKHEKSLRITALVWNPSDNNQLAFCDIEGQLGVIDEAVSNTAINQESENVENKTSFEGVFDDDDDMLIQATVEKQSVLDDEASEDGFTATAVNKISKPNTIEDDSDDDDFMKDIKTTDKDDDDASSIVSAVQPVRPLPLADAYKPTPLQKAFQPGSTPIHLSSRFMKWNCVGIIRQYNNDEENSIDVEFHDTSTHHPLHISNNMDYTMADLSSEAVVLASHSYDDTPSKLTCMHFGSWDNAKEWSISMSDDEDIQAVTIGNGWLAIATSSRNVRIFTVAGLQQDTFIIPGPIVSMAAKNNKLILVYHRGMGIPGEQLLGVSLLTVGSRKRTIFNDIPLPISPKTTLTWIGFSEEGTPFSVDSSGILRMLNKGLGFQWSQVANTKDQAKGKSDHYWIVSLHENPQQIRCIPCKGSRYPATLPRPAVAILPYQLPLCEMTTEKSQFEECLLRCQLFSHNLPADSYELEEVLKPSQEALMKLFALAVRSDREQRALEVCKLMTEDHTLQLAIKYASRLRKLQLAERISQLAQVKTDDVEEEEEEDNLFNTVNYQADDWSNSNGHVIAEEPMEEEIEDDIVDDNIEEREEADGQDQPTSLLLNTKPKPKTTGTAAAPLIGRSNPFKISTQEKIKQPVKGTQVFDGMNKKIEKPKSTSIMPISTKISKTNQKKIPSQSKLFTAKGEKAKTDVQKTCKNKSTEESSNKKCLNAFELWLEDNKTDLEEEHPDLSEEDFGSMATERFRSLSKDERQVWIQKAKSLKADAKNGDENTEQKKRKREDEDADVKSSNKKSQKETDIKKPLSQSTNAKLSNFAFSKD